MKNNKDIITPIHIEPMQELLVKALISEDQKAVQYCNEWLENIDLDKVDAGSYRLVPMLYKKLVKLEDFDINNESMGRLKGIYKYYFYNNNLIIHRLFKTFKTLHDAGIRIMLLKGIALILGGYYEDCGLRPIHDADIFVGEDKVDETIKLLAKNGWKRYSKYSYYHSVELIKKEEYILDLHWYLLSQCCWNEIDSDLWEYTDVINYKDIPLYILSPADQILHNCAHGVKESKIPSFRWIIDVIIIIDSHKNSIDWNRLISESKRRLLALTMFYSLQYIESIANGRVPGWVLSELHKVPVKRSEKILFNANLGKSMMLRSYWVLHLNNNIDKSLFKNLLIFPQFIKALYGLRNYFVIPGFLISKVFHKFFKTKNI